MTSGSGLRARVAVSFAAAVSISFGLIALGMLLTLRAEVRKSFREGATRLAAVVVSEVDACPDASCARAVAERASVRDAVVRFVDAPGCSPPCTLPGAGRLTLLRPSAHGVVEIGIETTGVAERVLESTQRLSVLLVAGALLLVVLGTLLLERGLVRRLAEVQDAIGHVERFELDQPLFASREGGDTFGGMLGTVRRVAEKLRADRLRTRAHIEELEQANRALTETREGLARSERLATVGRLAAGVAHEIGNPVAAILGYVEVQKMAGPSAAYVERIEREARRIDRIVRDLLDFARPQKLEVGVVRLGDVLDGAARLVRPQPKWRDMALVSEAEPGLPAVQAQEHYATQVFVNLLMNAADACGGKGVVTVRARRAGDDVEVIVADDGPGVPAELRQRIFDPFFTTKGPGEGTGLGLAICHRLMESFGGRIVVGDNEPRGALFTLTFRGVAGA